MGLVDWVPGPGLAASQMTSAVFVFGGGFEIGHSFDGGSPGPGLYKPYVAMASQWRSPVIFCSNVYNIKSIGMLVSPPIPLAKLFQMNSRRVVEM
jgi:hypothetical protein